MDREKWFKIVMGEKFKVDALIPEDRPLIIRNVFINALLTKTPQKAIRAESKLTRANLAQQIFDNDEVEFNIKELAMLGELCDELYQEPLIYAQIAAAIEGNKEKKEDKPKSTEPSEKK